MRIVHCSVANATDEEAMLTADFVCVNDDVEEDGEKKVKKTVSAKEAFYEAAKGMKGVALAIGLTAAATHGVNVPITVAIDPIFDPVLPLPVSHWLNFSYD